MKSLLLLLPLAVLTSCSNVADSKPVKFRGDVLYFENTERGREAARKTLNIHGRKQEVQVVNQEIPAMQFPHALSQARPLYPLAMHQQHVEGEVTVDFIIDEFGSVFDAVVVETDNPGLNDEALNAVRKWRFRPAQREGVNCRSDLEVPIIFSLHP